GMSRRSLYMRLAALGTTPGGLIRRTRLDRARKDILQDRKRSLLDIALANGFGDGASFSRAFRIAYGHPPSELRRLASIHLRLLGSCRRRPPPHVSSERAYPFLRPVPSPCTAVKRYAPLAKQLHLSTSPWRAARLDCSDRQVPGTTCTNSHTLERRRFM